MKFLEKILSEDTYKELTAKLGEELTQQVSDKLGDYEIDVAKERYIPKAKFDELNEKKKSLETELTARDEQLNSLSTQAQGNAELEAKIKELQELNDNNQKEYKTKIKETSQNYAFKEALSKFKPRNQKALEALLDKEKIQYEEKNGAFEIKGLNEQIEELKKTDGYLFGEVPSGTGMPQNSEGLDVSHMDGVTQAFLKNNPGIKL